MVEKLNFSVNSLVFSSRYVNKCHFLVKKFGRMENDVYLCIVEYSVPMRVTVTVSVQTYVVCSISPIIDL